MLCLCKCMYVHNVERVNGMHLKKLFQIVLQLLTHNRVQIVLQLLPLQSLILSILIWLLTSRLLSSKSMIQVYCGCGGLVHIL